MTDRRSRLPAQIRAHPRHLLFLANFTVSKAAVYLAPLLVAALASAQLYGGIELGLAIGLQACAVLLGAPLSGITQVYLIGGDRRVADLLLFLTFISALALSLLTGLLWVAGADALAVLVVSMISVTVLQSTASTWLRMRGERNRTAWIDGASFLIAGTVVIGVVLLAGNDRTGLAALVFALVTGLLTLVSGAMLLRHRAPDLLARLGRVSRIGLPMMVAGIFAAWLGVGGRILVGIASPADLAVYSLAFRISGLALGLHQLATTAAFPSLYATRTRQADQLLGLFMAGVLAVSAILAIAGPLVIDVFSFSALHEQDKETFRALVPLTSFQTYFWIGYALLQLRINRSGASKASIVPILLVTAGGIGAILLVAFFISNDIRLICGLIALHSVAYFATAWLILAKRRLPHRKIAMLGLAGGAVLGAIVVLTV